jgi:hypothetical protein
MVTDLLHADEIILKRVFKVQDVGSVAGSWEHGTQSWGSIKEL